MLGAECTTEILNAEDGRNYFANFLDEHGDDPSER